MAKMVWGGRFIRPSCAAMLIVAAGVSFSESETAGQKLSSPTPSLWGMAAAALSRCGRTRH
jgi:hypothetical protein